MDAGEQARQAEQVAYDRLLGIAARKVRLVIALARTVSCDAAGRLAVETYADEQAHDDGYTGPPAVPDVTSAEARAFADFRRQVG